MFSKKHEMIKKLAREFAENEITPVATQTDEAKEYPGELRRKIIDCGFHTIVIPKEYGGCGGDTVLATVVTEEFTKVDADAFIQLMPDSLPGGSLMMFGNEAQKQKCLRGMAEGELIDAFAITEPGVGSNTATITTTVETDGDYYILNGRKCFVISGPCCGFMTVFAKTGVNVKGVKRISTSIVEPAWEGFPRGTVENEMGTHGSPTCDSIFENVRMPKESPLASEGQDFEIYMAALDSGRITVATQDLGIVQDALDEAVKYVRGRVQLDKPISKFQDTQFEIADMAAKMERRRQLVHHAAELKNAGRPYSKNAVVAKYYCDDLCNSITYRSLQFHGEYGYMKDYPIEYMLHDVKLVAIYEGTSGIQRMVIASHVLEEQ